MAEQNILNGNQKQLEQIIGDMKEHNSKKERLEKLSESVKDISKELDNAQKEKQNETDSKIKASIDAICDGYDKSINADKEKIKNVTVARDKAKMAGVKDRINAETASLRAENSDLAEQINEAFIHENISKICNSQIFIAVFNPVKLLDYVIDVILLLVIFAAVPVILFVLPVIPQWILLVYCIAVSLICMLVIKCIYRAVLLKHKETILAAQDTRIQILDNKKRIKKIEKNIKKDKNEDMYGLESYDSKINSLHDEISRIEEEKNAALEEFENTTKKDIVNEINERYEEKLSSMETELQKKKAEYDDLVFLVKKQRIYISSNYEAYLGKDFMSMDKLSELNQIMKSDSADTIAQALAVYNNRH